MRRKKELTLPAVMTIALLGLLLTGPDQATAQAIESRTVSHPTSKGMAAIGRAAKNGKYLFIFFWKENDPQTRSMFGVFKSAMDKTSESADSVNLQVSDSNEKPVVDKFDVSRAPMPLVLALAPNGAITKGFSVKFTEQQLRQAFVSPGTAKCLKALQGRKLVLLCVQNQQTQFSQIALEGASKFKADTRFANAAEIVTVNPSDKTETSFLQALQVDPKTPQAVTVLLAPPGKPIARFTGAVSKEQIAAKVASAQTQCCPGGKCGPGGQPQ